MPSNKPSFSRSFSNSEKVRICRVFLLIPVACVLVICFVLLLCMKIIPDMETGDNFSPSSCLVVNCTVKHGDNDSVCTAPLSGFEERERLITTGQKCLKTVVRFLGVGDDSEKINESVLPSDDNHTEEWCYLCYDEKTKSNQREHFLKRWERDHNAESRCTIVDSVDLKPDNCSTHTDHEEDAGQRMRNNSKSASLVLVVILSLVLIGLFFMLLYTSTLMKLCCHLCYDEEAQ